MEKILISSVLAAFAAFSALGFAQDDFSGSDSGSSAAVRVESEGVSESESEQLFYNIPL